MVSHSSPTRTRTANSVVWKDTRAYELTSTVRFVWDKYQTKLFECFLKTVGLNFKNCDLTPLLVQLNLDGYEDVENSYGDNVHSIIHVKVQRKLRSMADEMDEDILMAASMGSKQKMTPNKPHTAKKTTDNNITPRADHPVTKDKPDPVWDSFIAQGKQASWKFEFSPSSKAPTQLGKARDTSSGSSTGARLEPLRPLLKMPGKASAPEFTFRAGIMSDPKSPSSYGLRSSESLADDTSSGGPLVKTEHGISPPQSFVGLNSLPPTPTVDRSTSGAKETLVSRTPRRKVMKQLSGSLVSLCLALQEVESALEDVGTEEGHEWDEIVSDLSLGIHDMKIDSLHLYEMAKQREEE
ncbi:hypothetical protein F5X99DRAFT_425340 [Biscogniauxia marginata]|nr:hypothetical protein F5X99DRAFT_425340 [Biscogniauxia marginata]